MAMYTLIALSLISLVASIAIPDNLDIRVHVNALEQTVINCEKRAHAIEAYQVAAIKLAKKAGLYFLSQDEKQGKASADEIANKTSESNPKRKEVITKMNELGNYVYTVIVNLYESEDELKGFNDMLKSNGIFIKGSSNAGKSASDAFDGTKEQPNAVENEKENDTKSKDSIHKLFQDWAGEEALIDGIDSEKGF